MIMIGEEIEQLRQLSYFDLVAYLKQKYGEPSEPFFINENCTTKNPRILRTSEGLFVHHVAENEHVDLSQPNFAKKWSFELQKPKNLVYCNYLEHILLHIAIVNEYLRLETIKKTREIVGLGGLVNFMFPEIIDYINGYEFKKDYLKRCLQVVDGNEFIFIDILTCFQDVSYDSEGHPDLWEIKYFLTNNKRFDLFKGKMIEEGRFNDLCYEYRIKNGLLTAKTMADIEKIIDKLSRSKGYINNVGKVGSSFGLNKEYSISWYSKNGLTTYDFSSIGDVSINGVEELINQKFKKFYWGSNNLCFVYIRKDASIKIVTNKNTKNKIKKYILSFDGVKHDYPNFSYEEAQNIINKNQ